MDFLWKKSGFGQRLLRLESPELSPEKKSINFAIIWRFFVWEKSLKYTYFDDFLLLCDHQHSQYIQDRFTFTDPHALIKLVTSETILCYKNHTKYKTVPYFWIIKHTKFWCFFIKNGSIWSASGRSARQKHRIPF